jgi:hypothetical protein
MLDRTVLMRHPDQGEAVGTRIRLHDGKTSVSLDEHGGALVPEDDAKVLETFGYTRHLDPRNHLLDLSDKKTQQHRFDPITTVIEAPEGHPSRKVIFASSGHSRMLDSQWRAPVTTKEAEEAVATQGFRVVGHT